MVYSFTQISHYLACPRRYRHRYLDGWEEKDSRAGMLFGRAFEKALAAYFRREDAAAAFFSEWSAYRDNELTYSGNDTWDRLLQEGFQVLDRFAQDDRVRIPRPRRNQQIKFTRPIPGGNEFVAYIDAIGRVDGTVCLIEWKTTSARYPEEPNGLLALDPQLVCYSWITGISEVAQVPAYHDHRRPAAGICRPARGHHPADRFRTLSASLRHPLSPEPVFELCLCGAVPGEARAHRSDTRPPAGRKLRWCV